MQMLLYLLSVGYTLANWAIVWVKVKPATECSWHGCLNKKYWFGWWWCYSASSFAILIARSSTTSLPLLVSSPVSRTSTSGTTPVRCVWLLSGYYMPSPEILVVIPPGNTIPATSPSAPAVCEPTTVAPGNACNAITVNSPRLKVYGPTRMYTLPLKGAGYDSGPVRDSGCGLVSHL